MRNTRNGWKRGAGLAAAAACATLALGACGGDSGGGSIADQTKANESKAAEAGDCGEVNMAVNPWVGYEADAYVVGTLMESELGCKVNYKELKEDVSWQGFGTGEVDVVLEDWGHPDLEKKFFAENGDGSAVAFGETGNIGIIGWYVPPWLAKEHPEVLDYTKLNDFAKDFATSESGGKGQFLGADPSYVQFDESIVSNLDLDFKVVFSGSEAASITAFQQAEEKKKFLIGYFYEPQWLFADIDLQRVKLPPNTPTAVRTTQRRWTATTRRPRCRRSSRRSGPTRVARRSTWSRPSSGPTTIRTSWRSTSPRTAWLPPTPRRSGSARTRTRSTPGSPEPALHRRTGTS